ncbi:MAG: succinate dehydrogenase, cytochrome b556 subunit [Gammaproteobacteria bacterium]
MVRNDRPLSPHAGIYRWEVSNLLSIVHRMTGVGLSFGVLALVGWLVAIASGPIAHASANGLFASLPGVLMLFGWTFCFFYHLSNGIRHLAWDTGRGFDKDRARQTGWLVVAVALTMTAGTWIVILGT